MPWEALHRGVKSPANVESVGEEKAVGGFLLYYEEVQERSI